MFRLLSVALVVAAALPSSGSPALAASDITIAAVTTGRLYVVGTTEHPHTAVMLDDRFPTESDDNGKFQYELIYHPASCIVVASIEGVSHEAVVSNCGQQVMPGTWLEPHAAVDAPALLKRIMRAEPEASSASFCPVKPHEQSQTPVPAQSSLPPLPVFTAAAWANLSVQSEPPPAGPAKVAAAPASQGTVPSVLATGARPPLLIPIAMLMSASERSDLNGKKPDRADFAEQFGTGPKQHCEPRETERILLSHCPEPAAAVGLHRQ